MEVAIYLAMMLVSVVLIASVLLQSKGGGLGSAFGGDNTSVQRTRRGFEKLLFQFTIAVSFVYFSLALLASFVL
ncbi:MAG: preprotein translocase subunit SecG [Thermomicrobiaceae bacterium]